MRASAKVPAAGIQLDQLAHELDGHSGVGLGPGLGRLRLRPFPFGLAALGLGSTPEPRGGEQADHEGEHQANRQRRGERTVSGPPHGSPHGTDRMDRDRLAVQEPMKIVPDSTGGLVPPGRIFLQTLEADPLQVRGDARRQAPGRDQTHAGLRFAPIGRNRLILRRLAGQEVIERRPQAVDVHGGGQDGVDPELLGRRIRGRTGDESVIGRGPSDAAGQPEIGQDRLVVSSQHDVRRLDVAVQDARAGIFLISARWSLQFQLVDEIERVGDLGQDAGRPARILGSLADPLRQRLAIDQLGRDERRAGLRAALDGPRAEIAHDVAMADVGQDLGLADQ